MASIEKGEIAKHKYNQIKFSYVPIKAGEQHVLTSDPWSFLSSYLIRRLPNTRGNNHACIERAFYFSGLAEEFYKAAEQTPLPAKGTLLYYGMLNLVKCYLSINGVALETTYEHHGLMLPLGKKTVITSKPPMKDAINIFSEFSEMLGKPITAETDFDLKTALSHIPEIHGIFSSLGHIAKRKFLPVTIEILTNKDHNKLFSEISYKKEQESKVDSTKFEKDARKSYFKEGHPKDGFIVYRSIKRKSYTKLNIDKIYNNILHEYREFDVVSILTRQGYRYYIDLKPGDFSFLSYSLAAMFYVGSAARYRPVEMKNVLEGELRPLITELVSLTPKQFLYHLVSLVTEKECVIPFSAL